MKKEPVSEKITPPTASIANASARNNKSGVFHALSALRNHNYRLYWFGQLVSVIGTFMQITGQTWLVLQLTHSAWQIGFVGALQSLPILLFSLFGGLFADRWPKRRILLVTQMLSMLQALTLWALLATGTLQLWHLYTLVVLLGITNSLGRPTLQAFIVELVGREDLPNAIPLNSFLSAFARIVGPSLSGILIAVSGVNLLFLLNGLSFLPVIVCIALIQPNTLFHSVAQSEGNNENIDNGENNRKKGNTKGLENTMARLRDGMTYIWSTPTLVITIVVVGLVLLFGSNFNVVLPLFATNVLHVGAPGFGFLYTSASFGAVLAILWLVWRSRQPTVRNLLLIMLSFALLEIVFAASRNYALSLLLIAIVVFMEEMTVTLAVTLLQTTTSRDMIGRVVSVQILFYDGSLPLGYILMGWLSSLFNAPIAVDVGALGCILVVGCGAFYWRRTRAMTPGFSLRETT